MSDATNEDSAEKSKVAVGFVWSMAASGDAIQKYNDSDGELQAEQQFSCSDLQDVHTGTAMETLKIFERQLQSVSCPTWREDAPARIHRIFVLVVDSAGNTILGGKMIRRIRGAMLVAPILAEYAMVLCCSRCVKIQCRERGTTRFGALCNFESVAVTWRFQEDLSKRCQSFQRTGGIRRREEGAWQSYTNEMGSMNDIEKIVSAGHLYLASSFKDVFPNVQRCLTKPLEQVGAEERELLRARRVRAVRYLNDIRFVINVFASDIAQHPLKHLFDCMQSRMVRSIWRKQRIPGSRIPARQSYRSSLFGSANQSGQNSTCSSRTKRKGTTTTNPHANWSCTGSAYLSKMTSENCHMR